MHKPGRLRARLHEATPAAIEKLISLAHGGDLVALKLLLDRVVPALKPEADRVQFALPTGSPTEAARELLQLAANGTLAPDTAELLIGALAKFTTIEQGTELRDQLALLMSERFGDIA